MQRATRSVSSSRTQPSGHEEKDEKDSASDDLCSSLNNSLCQECSICLCVMELPIQLPCSHYFCYTCAKGLAQTNRTCAMCRHQIPQDFLHDPDKYVVGIIKEPNLEHAWFYEGTNGWWMYEPRVQSEVEDAFNNKIRSLEALIAGHLYVLDLQNYLQYRKDMPSKRRRIKRDLATSQHKGLAGLKQERRHEFPLGKE